MSQAFTGARAKLYINNQEIGYATDVRISEAFGYEPIRPLGNVAVKEWAPQTYDISASAARLVLYPTSVANSGLVEQGEISLKALGIMPVAEGNAARDDANLLRTMVTISTNGMTVHIIDRLSDTITHELQKCVIVARDLRISQGMTVGEDIMILGTVLVDKNVSGNTITGSSA